ncbi:MAG: oligosaccharide flippase family protein [Clostridia bacterium]|nr:oligosaccharide flippase family protein [Bacilli bacterium]MBR3511500.1 oligosaccharide flippase family protein [Clostridia bacterium]
MLKEIKNKYFAMPIQVRASFWFLVCTFMQKAINVITTPIFTRLMSPSEFGEYSIYSSWYSIFAVFITLNLSAGVFMRGLLKYKGKEKEFVSSMQFLTFVLVIFWISLYLLFSKEINYLTKLNTQRTILMILTIWLSTIYGFWAAKQRFDFQYRKIVPITIGVLILGQLLGMALMNILSDKVNARIIGTFIMDFIFFFGLFVSDIYKGKRLIDFNIWKYALMFNIPLIPHYLSQVILNSSDRIMIERLVNTSSAGIYGLAYSISQVMTMFNTALAQTEEPWLYKKIENKKIDSIKPIAIISFIFIAIVNLLLILLAPEIISVFAPKAYYEARWIIPPTAMSVYFSFSYYFFAVFEYYYEKTNTIALASGIGAVLNIVLNYIFIPIYGYFAAGYTTLVCFIIYSAMHYLFMHKICKDKLNGEKPISIKIFSLISIGFLLIGSLIQLLYNFNPFIRYICLIIILIMCLINRKLIYESLLKIKNMKKVNES